MIHTSVLEREEQTTQTEHKRFSKRDFNTLDHSISSVIQSGDRNFFVVLVLTVLQVF